MSFSRLLADDRIGLVAYLIHIDYRNLKSGSSDESVVYASRDLKLLTNSGDMDGFAEARLIDVSDIRYTLLGSDGRLTGAAVPARVKVTLDNRDGALDFFANSTIADRNVLIGKTNLDNLQDNSAEERAIDSVTDTDIYGSAVELFEGVSISLVEDKVELLLDKGTSLFDAPMQTDMHRGFVQALKLDGGTVQRVVIIDKNDSLVASTSQVNLSHYARLEEFTIEFWFMRESQVANGRWVNFWNGGGGEWLLVRDHGSNSGLDVRMLGGLGDHNLQDDSSLLNDHWYHVAVTYSPSGGSALYVDGDLQDSNPANGKAVGPFISAMDVEFSIGINNASVNPDGLISDVRVWNHARSEREIRSFMHSKLDGNEKGLVSNWPLNEGTGSTATDIGPAGVDGTLTDSPVYLSAAEGLPDLAGKTRQMVLGQCFNIPLQMVDNQDLIYFVSSGQIESVDAVYDRGVVLTLNKNDYADIWAFLEASGGDLAGAGEYDVWQGSGTGNRYGALVRLGAEADGQVTADVKGRINSSKDLFDDRVNAGFHEVTSPVNLGDIAGGLVFSDGAARSLNVEENMLPRFGGVGILLRTGEKISKGQILSDLCRSVGAFWSPTQIGDAGQFRSFEIGIIDEPSTNAGDVDGDPAEDFDVNNIYIEEDVLSFRPVQSVQGAETIEFGFKKNWTVQDEDAVADSVSTDNERMAFLKNELRQVSYTKGEDFTSSIRIGAEGTGLVSGILAAEEELYRQINTYGRPAYLVEIVLPYFGRLDITDVTAEANIFKIGDTVRLFKESSPFMGLQDGEEFVIIEYTKNLNMTGMSTQTLMLRRVGRRYRKTQSGNTRVTEGSGSLVDRRRVIR